MSQRVQVLKKRRTPRNKEPQETKNLKKQIFKQLKMLKKQTSIAMQLLLVSCSLQHCPANCDYISFFFSLCSFSHF